MSTLTMGFWQRNEHGMGQSFVLSALVHIVLAVVLVLGVRWQVRAPDVVEVDLVAAPPPAPVVEPPKPLPKVEPPPVVKPPPPKVEKPQIAVPDKPKPKPKPKPEVKPKEDPEFEKRWREQVAQEQRALDQQQLQQLQERQMKELLARKQAEDARAAAASRAKALNEYISRIQGAIRQRIRESELAGIVGNPAAEFEVVQIPSGDVITIRMRRSSGYPRYDAEVERAIRAASPLPQPPSRDLFERELKLTFRPQDK